MRGRRLELWAAGLRWIHWDAEHQMGVNGASTFIRVVTVFIGSVATKLHRLWVVFPNPILVTRPIIQCVILWNLSEMFQTHVCGAVGSTCSTCAVSFLRWTSEGDSIWTASTVTGKGNPPPSCPETNWASLWCPHTQKSLFSEHLFPGTLLWVVPPFPSYRVS